MKITEDDLSSDAIAALLREHLDDMIRHSPPGSVNALDLDALRAPDITFFAARDETGLLGCGALKELDPQHGEIKSMRTAQTRRRQGVGSALLTFLIDEAARRSYSRLSLETGSGPAFEPANSLYRKFGFSDCGPFAGYRDNPFSRFMTLEL